MNRKGQSIWEFVIAVGVIFIVALILTGVTMIFWDNLVSYFVFIGWFALLVGIAFGISGNFSAFGYGGVAWATFFFLAYIL